MIASSPRDRDRLQELLAQEALFGLEEQETREREQLQSRLGDYDFDAEAYARVIAESELALLDRLSEPPASLTEKLLRAAQPVAEPASAQPNRVGNWRAYRERVAWTAAMVASLLALAAWKMQPDQSAEGPPSFAQVATFGDAQRAAWTSWTQPGAAPNGLVKSSGARADKLASCGSKALCRSTIPRQASISFGFSMNGRTRRPRWMAASSTSAAANLTGSSKLRFVRRSP